MSTTFARPWADEALQPEEQVALRKFQDNEFSRRFRKAAFFGALTALVAAVSCLPQWPASWAMWGFGAGVSLAIALPVVRWLLGVSERPMLAAMANVAIGCVAALVVGQAAAQSAGLAGLGAVALQLFWLYATVAVPTRPTHLVVAIVLQTGLFALPSLLGGSSDGAAVYLVISLGGGAVFVMAALERQAAEARAFVTRERLQLTQSLLAASATRLGTSSEELERRVDEQLESVLLGRRKVQRLHRALNSRDLPDDQGESQRISLPSLDHPRQLDLGQVLGARARIVRLLSSGGFGDVYLAQDLVTGEEIVAKVMRCDEETSPAQMKRFLLEADAASAVQHPAVVRILNVDISAHGVPFLLCERIEGVTLRWCVEANVLRAADCLAVFGVVVDALSAVHQAGLVHRDVKPENIMLHPGEPGVKLLDFGISRFSEAAAGLTEAGELLGTAAYMAPEQISGGSEGSQLGPATDVYALGLSMFECLAGEHPLAGKTPVQMVRAHLSGELPALRTRAPLVDGRVCQLVDAMLHSEPEKRSSLADVRNALLELSAGSEPVSGLFARVAPDALRKREDLRDQNQVQTLEGPVTE